MSGVMETAFCALRLTDQFIRGTANLESPDPECDFFGSSERGAETQFTSLAI